MNRILLAGAGLFHARLESALSDLPLVRARPGEKPLPGECVLLAHDAVLAEEESEWQKLCFETQAALLPVRVEGTEVVIGPWSKALEPGCVCCLESRRQAVHPRKSFQALNTSASRWLHEKGKGHPWLTPFVQSLVEDCIRAELSRWRQGVDGALKNRVWLIELSTGCPSEHTFLPFPSCPVCGGLPEDKPEGVEAPRASIPKTDPQSFRVSEQPIALQGLRQRFVDHRMGLVANEFLMGDNELVSLAIADLALDFRDRREPGIGRSLSFAESQLTGLLEALERYAGLRPRGKRTTVKGCYRQLEKQAINPASLILHAPEQYLQPGFPFVAYHPELEFHWVWGHSFLRQAPVLVPEQCAYYRMTDLTREPNNRNHFVYEISNGCALGGCLEEAILHGLFEVAERDGFLMTWYAELPAPRVDPRSFGDPGLNVQLDRLESRGFQVHVFNTTYDLGIPSVWVMAVYQGRDGPQTVSAGGAHLNPLKAVQGGMAELAAGVFDLVRRYPKEREHALRLVTDAGRVRSMDDHALLYMLPEALNRFDFLLGGDRPMKSARESFPAWYEGGPSRDLAVDLEGCIQRFRGAGCDVIAVDQTPLELRQAGLRAVKVLATGTLTMTFGEHMRRLEGAARLSTVPVSLGYRAAGPFRVNPHPHPFP